MRSNRISNDNKNDCDNTDNNDEDEDDDDDDNDDNNDDDDDNRACHTSITYRWYVIINLIVMAMWHET